MSARIEQPRKYGPHPQRHLHLVPSDENIDDSTSRSLIAAPQSTIIPIAAVNAALASAPHSVKREP